MDQKRFLNNFGIRGHSTTTWTRRGGWVVSKKSTLVSPGYGGVPLNVPMDQNLRTPPAIYDSIYFTSH